MDASLRSKWFVIVDGIHYVIYDIPLKTAHSEAYRSELYGKYIDGTTQVYF